MVQDLRLVDDVMNVMSGQPDGATGEEMRRHLNQDGGPPGGYLLLPLLPWVHLVLQVFLLLGALPLLFLLGLHLLGVLPLPVARELLPITHPLPITVVTVTVTTVITLVPLYTVAGMVALGALAGLVVVVLRGVLGELLDKEIWLGVWVLVWEREVVARKVMREVLRETIILGMWVLGVVVAVVVGW